MAVDKEAVNISKTAAKTVNAVVAVMANIFSICLPSATGYTCSRCIPVLLVTVLSCLLVCKTSSLRPMPAAAAAMTRIARCRVVMGRYRLLTIEQTLIRYFNLKS